MNANKMLVFLGTAVIVGTITTVVLMTAILNGDKKSAEMQKILRSSAKV